MFYLKFLTFLLLDPSAASQMENCSHQKRKVFLSKIGMIPKNIFEHTRQRFPVKIGEWIFFHRSSNGLKIVKKAKGKVQAFAFDSHKCELTLSDTYSQRLKTGPAYFTDHDLEKLIRSKQDTMIYLWSFDQIYSKKFYKTFLRASQKSGMAFIPVHKYRDIPKNHIKKWNLPSSFKKKNGSYDIFYSGALNHTPSAVIISNGKISRRHIVGVMELPSLLKEVKRRVGELK